MRQLEGTLGVALLQRTTRAVTPTQAGLQLAERAGAPLKLALEALATTNAAAGEIAGRLKLSVAESAIPLVVAPVVPVFRERHPRVALEVVIDKRYVFDFVAEGCDAAIQGADTIARDMARVRVTDPFRYLVVGSPSYFAKHGAPRKPEDLLEHECITFRWPVGDALYAWEFERGKRKWRVPVRGSLTTNSLEFCIAMAEAGQGLAYVGDINLGSRLSDGRLEPALEAYAPSESGLFLCYPSHAQRAPALRAFVETSKEVLRRK